MTIPGYQSVMLPLLDLMEKQDPANGYRGYGMYFDGAGDTSLKGTVPNAGWTTAIMVYTTAGISTGA